MIEPVLDLGDIQGLALPGLLKPFHTHLYLRLSIGSDKVVRALARLVDEGVFTSGRTALADRQAYQDQSSPTGTVLAGLALSVRGLEALRLDLSRTVPSPAFRVGMIERAGLLGDPGLDTWDKKFGGMQTHGLLVLAGDDRDAVDRRAEELAKRLGCPVAVQTGSRIGGEGAGREHFGFADNISQPGIRGRHGTDPTDFITPRRLPADDPEHDLFGWPGQHLVWPGEFVLGYPASSADPRIPGPARAVPPWMHNGSFLVYRRLRQDVAGFRRWLAKQAAALKDLPGFAHLTDEQRVAKLGAKVVGRWPSGAPLSRAPEADDPDLGADRMRNNDFRFDDDSPLRQGDVFPPSRADSLGLVCPVSAHIRKVNVRDQASDMGGTSATQARRILRAGVPYGPPLPDGADDDGADRGLLFMSIQASIEDQFEFLQARWMNSGLRPRAPGGHDLLVGQDGTPGTRLFGSTLSCSAAVVRCRPFVTMTGGGYFFVPSLTALADLVSGKCQSAD